MGEKKSIPIPVIFTKEKIGKKEVFVATSPVIEVATQGKTFEEAEKNMKEAISLYMEDKDTPKPKIGVFLSVSVVTINVPRGVLHRKTPNIVRT